MTKIKIKPLSVNKAWQGKRFKTPEYHAYEKELLLRLPKKLPFMPDPPYAIDYEFGFSNMASDIDNPVKLLQDILAKKYDFNDREIVEITVTKTKVKKGQEFISFNITNIYY